MTVKSCAPLLNVEDCERSLAFYRDLLGFEVTGRFEHDGQLAWVQLEAGPVRLMLGGNGGPSAEARRRRPPDLDAVIYFGVDCAHEAYRRLAAAGWPASPPEAQAYGLDQVFLRDPDGYELALTSPTDLARRSA